MDRSTLEDAFAHHVWATVRLIDACLALSPEQLDTTVPGTYGSIIDTMRHLVGADASYLFVLTGETTPVIEEDGMDLSALREATERHGGDWSALIAGDLDGAEMVVRRRPDGSESRAPRSIRLAQALHHGTDHRSQICTALTTLGVDPPGIDVWDFAWQDDRLSETPPSS